MQDAEDPNTLKSRFIAAGRRVREESARLWTATRARTAALGSRISPRARRRALWIAGGVGGGLVAIILVLGLMDWNYLKRPVEGLLSARTGREVHIDGDLQVRLLSWSPGAVVNGLRIGNPDWAEGDMADIERLAVQVRLLPLLRGRVILPRLEVTRPTVTLVRLQDGRSNWTFRKQSDEPFSLPPIRRFEIRDGNLTIDDAIRRLTFTGTVNSSEIQDGRTVQAFRLLGDGRLNNEPFDMELTGGPLLNVDPGKPYPFQAQLTAGPTRVQATGSIAKPFDLAVFDTSLAISGQDLASLYYLTGLTLPNTPPYDVRGQLSRRGNRYAYDGLDGRIGDSDLRGRLSVETGGERVLLGGDLRSRRLDFDDLAAVLGAGASTTASDDASPEQAQAARELASAGRLLPDTPLRVERLRTMDAEVRYEADTITSAKFPVRSGSVDLVLQDAVLTLGDLTFGLENGQLAGQVIINAKTDTPHVDMDMRLSGARVDQFIPATYKGAISGAMLGRARLSGSGLSVREVAANADGQVSVVIPQGEMREALAEMLGVNLLRGLFTSPENRTDLRCAVADFEVTDGIMTSRTLVLDTGPVIAIGGGTINLKNEALDLRIKGHPKEARLVRLSIPLELTGRLRAPSLGVEAENAAGQGALAVLAASVVAPLAAILPFVDPGLEDDANCQALIASAEAA